MLIMYITQADFSRLTGSKIRKSRFIKNSSRLM